jgi:NhaA family Na+:H+ antiporter
MSESGTPTVEPGRPAVEPTWLRSDRTVPRVFLRPLQEFLQTATSGAILLFAAVVVALLWANSPWKSSYEALWLTRVSLGVGSWAIDKDLRFWIDDGLMTLFFLLVGLEIKREVVSGELRDPRAAVLPALAAVGGMIVPALVYVAVAGRTAPGGWGVPMATDIAFALGVLTLAAAHAPPSLKSLLLTLAIVDDIGAIIVIAVFYSGGVDWPWLAGALGVAALVVVSTRIRIRAPAVYVLLGGALWYATYRAGIHPTIAGVAMGLLTPAHPFQRPATVSEEAHRTADETVDDPEPPDADATSWLRLAWLSREAVSPLARVEHALLPWSSFVILPLFALANAGVTLTGGAVGDALTSVVALGIVLGPSICTASARCA